MADVFISYRRDDERKVAELARAIEAHGLSVWWDRSLEQNADFGTVIDREIDSAKAVVVCWSEQAGASQWVRGEANRANHQQKYLGALIGPCMPPTPFNALNNANLVDWNGTADHLALLKLLREVGRLSNRADVANLAESEQRRLEQEVARVRAAQEAERVRRVAAEEAERLRIEKALQPRPYFAEFLRAPVAAPRLFAIAVALLAVGDVVSYLNPLSWLPEDAMSWGYAIPHYALQPSLAVGVLWQFVGAGLYSALVVAGVLVLRSKSGWRKKMLAVSLSVLLVFAAASWLWRGVQELSWARSVAPWYQQIVSGAPTRTALRLPPGSVVAARFANVFPDSERNNQRHALWSAIVQNTEYRCDWMVESEPPQCVPVRSPHRTP
ncbi:MAG: toll/interleukin-1 receptor domain-containing protein [Terricaulis sp.]